MAKKSTKQLAALKNSRLRALEVRKEHVFKNVKENAIQKSKIIKSKSNDKYIKLLVKHMNEKRAVIRQAKKNKTEDRRTLMNAINENKTNAKDKAVKRIVKRSKRKQKPYNELSRSEQCRRRKHVEKIAPGSQLTSALTIKDALTMQMEGNFSKRDMGVIKKKIPAVAGYFSRNELQKRIIYEHPKQHSVKVNDKFEVKFFDFGELLEHDLKTIGVEELPSHLTIVLSGDYGQQT